MSVEGAPQAEGALNHDQEPKAESVKDVLAKSYFDEPRWWGENTLDWIAFRRIGAFTATSEDILLERYRATLGPKYRAILGVNDDVLVSRNPVVELLNALKAGGIAAIDEDHQDIKAESCDGVGYDPRTWPPVRFRREDVLRLWPSREKAGPKQISRQEALEQYRNARDKDGKRLRQNKYGFQFVKTLLPDLVGKEKIGEFCREAYPARGRGRPKGSKNSAQRQRRRP